MAVIGFFVGMIAGSAAVFLGVLAAAFLMDSRKGW